MAKRAKTIDLLRVMRSLVDAVLRELSPRFAELYSRVGGRRSRRRSCCAPCCCRCCTPSAASGC